MAKFENVFKKIGTFGYPLVQKIERQFYRWKHTGNMCKHFIERGWFCRGCDDDRYEFEVFFENHLNCSDLFHPFCEECDNMKAARTTDEHCHHLNSSALECEFCWRESNFERSLLEDPKRMEVYRLKLARIKKGIECQEICDECGSVSKVFINS